MGSRDFTKFLDSLKKLRDSCSTLSGSLAILYITTEGLFQGSFILTGVQGGRKTPSVRAGTDSPLECVPQFHSPDCNRLYEITKALIHVNTLRSLAFQGKCSSIPEKRCLKDLNTCSTKFLLPNVSRWWGIPIESMLYQLRRGGPPPRP